MKAKNLHQEPPTLTLPRDYNDSREKQQTLDYSRAAKMVFVEEAHKRDSCCSASTAGVAGSRLD